jgi:D-arabinose 1-dehydrogenase-like Zn-dependent alcohol dehydrogenase
MAAAVLTKTGAELELQTVPRPVPTPGETLVRIRAAGLCHTDLHLAAGVPTNPPLPLILGHEIAGEVVECLPAEECEPDFVTGDRVLVYYYDGCANCDWCAAGLENLCRAPKSKYGFDTDGGFAEYISVPTRCLVKMPDEVGFAAAAALGCSGTTAVHVVHRVADIGKGDRVAVIGAGGVGLAVIQVAKARGAVVSALDTWAPSRDTAVRFGASETPAPDDLPPGMLGHIDCVVDTVGSDATVRLALQLIRPQGKVVLVGYGETPATLSVVDVVVTEVAIVGSVGATLDEVSTVLELAGRGELEMCTADELPLDGVNDAMTLLQTGEVVGRLILRP